MKTGLLRSVAAAFIATGLIMAGRVGVDLWNVQHQDDQQSKAWQTFVGAAAGADASSANPDLYLKLTIPKLGKDAIAANGNWDSLKKVSMVHYKDSPAPGQKGNVLVAFHRETHWLDINTIGAGDAIVIQTADGRVFHYKIDFVQTVPPAQVDLLKPTSGNDLTLITCDPVWQDYNRMYFRAHLTA